MSEREDGITMTPYRSFTIANEPTRLQIADLVVIDLKSGEITYRDGYTPDKAAATFWEALSSEHIDRGRARYREAIEAAAKVAENCRGPSYDGIVHCEEIAQAIRALGEKTADQ